MGEVIAFPYIAAPNDHDIVRTQTYRSNLVVHDFRWFMSFATVRSDEALDQLLNTGFGVRFFALPRIDCDGALIIESETLLWIAATLPGSRVESVIMRLRDRKRIRPGGRRESQNQRRHNHDVFCQRLQSFHPSYLPCDEISAI